MSPAIGTATVEIEPLIVWTHITPPHGSGLTPCCGRTPFELPRTDRMTNDPLQAACPVLFLRMSGDHA